jgi:hypothetical protein
MKDRNVENRSASRRTLLQRNTETGSGGALSRRNFVKGAAVAIPALAVPSLGALTQPASAAATPYIDFGQSGWARTPSDDWQWTWSGASIQGFYGVGVPTSQVLLRWWWYPLETFDAQYMRVISDGAPNWAFPAPGTQSWRLDYDYEPSVTDPDTVVPIPDGVWFDWAGAAPWTQVGNITCTLMIDEYEKEYRWHLDRVLPPPASLVFHPGLSQSIVVAQEPAVAFADATIEFVHGNGSGYLPPNNLFLRAKITSRSGTLPSGTKIDDFWSQTFTGWKLSRLSSTEFQYLYSKGITATETVPLLPGTAANAFVPFHGTTKVVPGDTQFLITVGSLTNLLPTVEYYFNF